MSVLKQLASRLRHLARDRAYFALNDLDRKLERYLDFDDGYFVEAGGNDGLNQSNTAYFERSRGWTGVLVEPVPRLASLCRANRPGAVVIECALISRTDERRTLTITDCGLMSVVEGAMSSDEERVRHVETGARIQSLVPVDLEVAARTLDNVLEGVPLPRIDLLSLDVEGFEEQVLLGTDLRRWRPRFVLVEARYRDAIDAVMAAGGYEPAAELSHHDVLYRPTTGTS